MNGWYLPWRLEPTCLEIQRRCTFYAPVWVCLKGIKYPRNPNYTKRNSSWILTLNIRIRSYRKLSQDSVTWTWRSFKLLLKFRFTRTSRRFCKILQSSATRFSSFFLKSSSLMFLSASLTNKSLLTTFGSSDSATQLSSALQKFGKALRVCVQGRQEELLLLCSIVSKVWETLHLQRQLLVDACLGFRVTRVTDTNLLSSRTKGEKRTSNLQMRKAY